MDKQDLLQLIAKVVPQGAREMVPHAIKEPIVNLFSTEKPPPPPHFLEVPHLLRAPYEVLWREALAGVAAEERTAFAKERVRHYERCNAIAYFFPDWRLEVDVLAVGAAEFSAFYQRLFPRMRLAVVDGESIEQAPHAFDMILCTDALVRSAEPAGLMRRMVELLKPHGLLYVSVPNGLANPPRQPGLAMADLHAFAAAAEGRVITSYWSACWDERPPLRRDERSVLVAVIARKL